MSNTVTSNTLNHPGAAMERFVWRGWLVLTLIAVFFLALGQTVLWPSAARAQTTVSNKAASPQSLPTRDTPVSARPSTASIYGGLPLSFEANQGQADQKVKFLARGQGYGFYLTANEAVLALSKPVPRADGANMQEIAHLRMLWPFLNAAQRRKLAKMSAGWVGTDTLRMELKGANAQAQVSGSDELPGTANYFLGSDPSRWRTRVPTFAKVHYSGVYPGIDLIYYGNQRKLEYDFVVAPHADPSQVKLHFSGAQQLKLDDKGNLLVFGDNGEVAFEKPVVYQDDNGQRVPVKGRYVLLANHAVRFRVGKYDHSKALVIDPTLSYSTYLGGSTDDAGIAVAVDAGGNIYVTGFTVDSDFPVTPGAFQTTNTQDNGVAFVAKLNGAGSALVYATYLGGAASATRVVASEATGIAVDPTGNAYVCGETYANDFPVSTGAFQTKNNGFANSVQNAFISKLNPDGTALVYSTYLGGTGLPISTDFFEGDSPLRMALDAAGSAYVVGTAHSTDFPTTTGAYQVTNKAAANLAGNAFVAKLSPDGSSLAYSTYLGGSGVSPSALPNNGSEGGGDEGYGITVVTTGAATGEAYVSGYTYSADFPVTTNAFQKVNNGTANVNVNAYVSRLNATGTGLVDSTYLGGTGVTKGGNSNSAFDQIGDEAVGLVLDASGNVYTTGVATSTDFPTTTGAYQTTNNGAANSAANAFVAKLDPTLSTLMYSTYVGGSGIVNSADLLGHGDFATGIVLDTADDAYITGITESRDFPVTSNAFQSGPRSPQVVDSGFFTEVNPNGSALQYSTYLGGSGASFFGGTTFAIFEGDIGYDIALDPLGNAYISGYAFSYDFPVTKDALQRVDNATGKIGGNAFIAKFGATAGVTFLPTTTTLTSTTAGANVTFTAVVKPVTGTGVPTGTVNFYVNSVATATATLDTTGTATFTTNALPDSLNDVIAAYSGDATYGASGSSLGQNPAIPPGTATQLVFTTPPPSSIAPGGNGGTAVIAVEDGGGNIVTTPAVAVTVTITGPTGYTTQTLTATSVNGIATFNFANFPLTILGTYTYTATGGGLISAVAFESVTSVPVLTPTTLTLTVSPTFSFVGQPVTLTGTLSPFSTGNVTTNGEPVTFESNGVAIGTGTLTGGVATLITNALPAGAVSLTAVYGGDANFQGSTSNTVSYAVTAPSGSTTTLAVTSGGKAVTTVAAGSVVTLTSTVDAGGAVTQGQIIFCDANAARCENSAVLGTAQLTAAGTASLRFVPGIGSHSYKAVFAGTFSIATSTSAAQPLTVTGTFPTTTSLVSTGNPGSYTLTGTVVGAGVTSLSPTGSVAFIDQTNSNSTLGTVALGAGTFAQTLAAANGSPLNAGTEPYGVATGDFNGDGFTDFAVENYGDGTVSVFLGNGDGTFKPQVTYAVGTQPEHVVAADVNGDGKLDLVVANTGSNTVGVLLGNGDGTFQAQTTYATDVEPAGLVVADFNNDGKPDIATSNFVTGDVSVLLGNGDGTFQAQVTYAVGNQPRTLTFGDFSGNGIIDLAVANQQDNTLSILFGNGDGTFQAQILYTTGTGPQGVAVADFNGDGIPDLAIANSGDNTVGIMLGTASGTFQTMTTYAAGNNSLDLVVADFNGDGNADVAVENFNDNTESLLLGNGDGTLKAQTVFPTGTNPYSAAVGDFNGDGLPDLVISNFGSNNETILLDQATSITTAVLSSVSVTGAEGNHSVVATYPGDTNFATSTSTPVTLVVPAKSTPAITSLSPNSAYVGSTDTVVTITGTQFLSGAAVTVNGASQAATFVSATQLTTTLTVAQLSTAGTLNLVVVNPDGGASNAAAFTVLPLALQLSSTSLTFGNQTVGTPSAPQVVTVTNGTATALGIGITLDLGLNPGDFGQTNNCPATLAAGANCQVTITFNPGGVGAKSAGLLLTTNSQAPQQSVNMTGTGTGGILQVNPGNLKTIAGNGTAGYSGDGGAAIAAELNSPDGVNFDAAGNMYIADVVNNVIRKVDTSGNITTVAGNGTAGFSGDGGPATAAELHGPFGVTPDSAGNLYIQDALNARIRKVDTTTGIITTIAGNGTFGFSGDGGPATAAVLSLVQGARFDAAGNLYVAQCGPAAIRRIDTSGIITTVAGNGTDGFSGDGGPATAAQLNCPSGVVIDKAGELFIADYLNYRVRKVDAEGTISTIAGNGTPGFTGDGGPALSAEINLPNDVDLDAAGDVYIADSGNNRIREIDTTGVISTVVGGLNNAGSAGINAPSALAFDKGGNLYFSDSGNNAIREVFPAGALAFPTTVIGAAAPNETVTLANIGNLPVTIASEASFGLSGNTIDFSLAGGSCLEGVTLAANGGTCMLQIGFTPTATGTRTLTVSITDDAVYSPQSFSISGVGTIAPAVVLSSINPTGAVVGASATTITATGANFTPTSVVNFNGGPLVTTFVSATQLTAVVPAALTTTVGTANITITDPLSGSTSQPQVFSIVPSGLAVTFSGPSTTPPGEQPTLTFQLQQPYPVDLAGTMTLTFAPDPGNPANPQVQFASGGTTLNFTLPANSTATPAVMVQAGTVSGTITVTLQLTASGVNVTPGNVAPITIIVPKAAPTISAVSISGSGNTLTVLTTGYSTTREIQSVTFNFTPANGASLSKKSITVPATTLFGNWYTTAGSAVYGSSFTYSQQFTLSGSASAVGSVSVTLTNTVGISTQVTSQ